MKTKHMVLALALLSAAAVMACSETTMILTTRRRRRRLNRQRRQRHPGDAIRRRRGERGISGVFGCVQRGSFGARRILGRRVRVWGRTRPIVDEIADLQAQGLA